MQTAIVFNEESGFSKEMTAAEYERRYRGNKNLGIEPTHPEEEKDLKVISKNDASPLTFRKSHLRSGCEDFVHACWVRPDGQGDQDHVFDRNNGETLKQAVKSGKSVLLSLNLEMTTRPVSFKAMNEDGAQSLQHWVSGNRGNYISVSVRSAEEAISALKKVQEHGGQLNQRVFALHREAVVPYSNFYMGDNREQMTHLYNEMQSGKSGVSIGKTRMLGFPRLICIVPTDSTIDSGQKNSQKTRQGLKGNYLKHESGKPFYNTLIFANKDDALASDPYKILEGQLTGGDAEYVLASPTITTGHGSGNFKEMRWIIQDIEHQTMVLDEEARTKLIDHIKEKGYRSPLFVEGHQQDLSII